MNRSYLESQNGKCFSVLSAFIIIATFLVSCSPATATAVVPTATFTVIPPTPTFTAIPPTATATNTSIPPTPEAPKFWFVRHPIDPNINYVTLKDVNSGDYAEWLTAWHHCDAPVSQYTKFVVSSPASTIDPEDDVSLYADDNRSNYGNGFFDANNSLPCGIALFRPSEFNLKSPRGKDLPDLYLVTYQFTGPQGERTYINTLLSRKALDKLISEKLLDPGVYYRIVPHSHLDYIDAAEVLTNGDQNGDGVVEDTGDYRELNEIIYKMQNVPGINGPEDVVALYESISTAGLNTKFKDTGIKNRDILGRLVGVGYPDIYVRVKN
jgi:hypothetical protein